MNKDDDGYEILDPPSQQRPPSRSELYEAAFKESANDKKRIKYLERIFAHDYYKGEGIGDFPCEKCGLERHDIIHLGT